MFEWMALDRQQRLKVLHQLPDKLGGPLPPEDAVQVGALWHPSVDNVHEKVKELN